MFKKIKKIKHFGIYADFQGAELPDFQKFNLIFGWNYSGKTTFSRIFRCIELGELHKDYADASFSFVDETGFEHTSTNASTKKVRVFNDDFKVANFRWETGGAVQPILLLGKENIEVSDRLKKSEIRRGELEQEVASAGENADALASKLSRAETDCGNQIARELRIARFNKSNLRPVFASWGAEVPVPLSDAEFSIERERANSSEGRDQLPEIDSVVADPDLLRGEVAMCLSKSLTEIVVLESLISDPKLSEWVESGFEFHKELDHCQFCLSPLSVERVGNLEAHFSESYSSYKNELLQLREKVNGELCEIDGARYVKSAFFPEFHDEWVLLVQSLKEKKTEYNDFLQRLLVAIDLKVSNPFGSAELPEETLDRSELVGAIKGLNELVKRHNDRSVNFSKLKAAAAERLVQHYASDAMLKIDRFGVLKSIDVYRNQDRPMAVSIFFDTPIKGQRS